jgi:serine/threonine protein phosphatase PrpC
VNPGVVCAPSVRVIDTVADSTLVLASDGLWDVVGHQEAADIIRDADSCDDAARLLSGIAVKRGSADNVTVMVVSL